MFSISSFNQVKKSLFLITTILCFTGAQAQNKLHPLKEFSEESLILGDWELVRVEQNLNSTFLRKGFVKSRKLKDVSLKIDETSLDKIDDLKEQTFAYSFRKDSLHTFLILQKGEEKFKYELVEINHFSFTFCSEVSIQKGLDHSVEKIYYTYIRKGWDDTELKKILGTWTMCSDSIIPRFNIEAGIVFSFQKSEELNCSSACDVSLEVSRSSFQYLHNVKEEDAKSFSYISSSVLVNMEKRLIYLKMEKGLVYNILHLDENNLVLQLNRELSEKLL